MAEVQAWLLHFWQVPQSLSTQQAVSAMQSPPQAFILAEQA
jgi:hypothetical protein